MNPGIRLRSYAQFLLYIGPIANHLERGAEQLGRGLLSGGEKERGRAGDFDDLGCRSVWVLRRRERGQHVLARVATAVLDVGTEFVVEPLQGVGSDRLVVECPDPGARTVGSQDGPEFLVILLGNAEQIGNHQGGERFH